MVCATSIHLFWEYRISLTRSREPWPHPYLSELPLLHGEKFLTLTTENLDTAQHSQQRHLTLVDNNMIKMEVVDAEEAQTSLGCADPHLFYPEASLMQINILVSSSQLQNQDSFDATVYSAKSECPTPVGDCYDSSPTDSNSAHSDICKTLRSQHQLLQPNQQHGKGADTTNRSQNIRMEEFQDLDVAGLPVLSDPNLESTSAEHELNTPVFEKSNPFDVDLTGTVRSLSQSSNIQNTINNQPPTNSDYMFNYVIKEEPISDNSWFLDNVSEPSYTINITSDATTFNNGDSIFSQTGGSLFWPSTLRSAGKTFIHEDDIATETISDHNANSLNRINVLDEYIISSRESYDELNPIYKRECFSSGSSECSVDVAKSVPPALVLPEIGTIPNLFANDDAVNTPDVISTIEEIEADHKRDAPAEFNILQFISEQDIATSSNIIESLELPQVSTTAQSSSTNNFLPETNTDSYGRSRTGSHTSKSSYGSSNSKSSRRKRNNTYDDDEDYIPPTKRSMRVTQKPKTLFEYESDFEQLSSSDSDESVEYTKNKAKAKAIRQKRYSSTSTNTNVIRRGRPPVGSNQTTSSTSAAPADKYREMRDKNNEASRKSRLKKKQQDTHCFSEMAGLEQHNVQLKARVSELQKTVDNFRSNLMKVMLKQ